MFKHIFVILVYKNTSVLEDFFNYFFERDSKVIIVNSFYDDDSLEKCRKIAKEYNADFVPVENKGYGYGNNVGIQYALDNYTFKYLIVSNSDIIIKEFGELENLNVKRAIIAPETRMLTGKRQNPDTPLMSPLLFKITNIALIKDLPWLYLLTHIYTRLSRELFLIMNKFSKKRLTKIFAAHGSFFIVTEQAVRDLHPLFDERMFLYNEEWYLAMKARNANIPILYCPRLKVLHLEGASSESESKSFFKYNKQSYTIFYNTFFGKNRI